MNQRVQIITQGGHITDVLYSMSDYSKIPSHYWVIGKTVGPISTGECKYCHMEKDFYNSFDERGKINGRDRVTADIL